MYDFACKLIIAKALPGKSIRQYAVVRKVLRVWFNKLNHILISLVLCISE